MTLSEKIMQQRKQRGWSQEELAQRLDVTRQSVSKWESAQSVPDLDRILRMSELFGISTDYLLKDAEGESSAAPPSVPPAPTVSSAEAEAYLAARRRAARRIAAGVLLCILSPIPLLLGVGWVESFAPGTENTAVLIGLLCLFAAVAAAVMLFVSAESGTKPYLSACASPLCADAETQLRRRMAEFSPRCDRTNLLATVLCILSPVPLLACVLLGESVPLIAVMLSLTVTMLIVAAAVTMYILVGVPRAAGQRLLREGEFAPDAPHWPDAVRTAYWLTATAVYLMWSLPGNAWHISWVVWAAAGVLAGALEAILAAALRRRKRGR